MNPAARLALRLEEAMLPRKPEPLVENRPGYWLATSVGLWLLAAGFGCMATGALLTMLKIFLRLSTSLEWARQIILIVALLLVTVGMPVVTWAGSLSRLRIAADDLELRS